MRHPPEIRYSAGLDLGQAHEFTALAIVERTTIGDRDRGKHEERSYAVRHLERFTIGGKAVIKSACSAGIKAAITANSI
jgi:hypothetical protein